MLQTHLMWVFKVYGYYDSGFSCIHCIHVFAAKYCIYHLDLYVLDTHEDKDKTNLNLLNVVWFC